MSSKRKLRRTILRMTLRLEDVEQLKEEIFTKLPPAPTMTYTTLDGQEVVAVSLSKEMIKAAFYTGELIHTVASGKLHEWIQSNETWRSAGFRGQLAAAFFFQGDWRRAFEYIEFGKPDEGNLKLGNFIVNVCTRPKVFEGENYLIIDERRFAAKPYPIYVAVQTLDEDKVVIWGWARWDEVRTWEKNSFGGRSSAYHCPLNKLHAVKELKELIPM